ncbi:hypothetical protein H9P43_006945 [Blastocladiella emersonii ATCC 22665]|nr:hypothetical protein H9P43_006945 [Blastocladiella emersonii ATCC 22665]
MKLALAEIIEKVLVRAVHLHDDPNDVAGLSDGATRGFHSSVYSHVALSGANGKSLEAMEWWGRSGLPITHPQCPGGSTMDVLKRLNLGQLAALFPSCPRPPVEAPFVSINDAVAGISSGQLTKVAFRNEYFSLDAVAALNEAMASPNQALRSLKLERCAIDMPRLMLLRLPESLTKIEWSQGWSAPHADPGQPKSWSWPPHLESLSVTWSTPRGHALLLLSSLPSTLTSLSLCNISLERDAYPHLASLSPSITSLAMSNCLLTDDAFAVLFPHLPPGLVSLNISNDQLTATQLGALYHHFPPTLRSLDLSANHLDRKTSDAPLGWSFPAGLERLEMSSCTPYAQDLPERTGTLSVPQLELAALIAASLPPNLVSLDLSVTPLCGQPHFDVSEVITMLQLHFHEGGASSNYMWTCIGAAGAQHLAEHMPPQLESLDLSQTNLDDAAIQALAPALPQTLKKVCVNWNPFTDVGALVLAAYLPNELEELRVDIVELNAESIELLRTKVADGGTFTSGF